MLTGAYCQSGISPAAYYGYTGYTGFSSGSSILGGGASASLSFRFRFCQVGGGVLLETVGGTGEYFSVGVTSEQSLLVEFRVAGGEVVTQVRCAVVTQ